MIPYRVKVEAYVLVPARNAVDAKARAELALRRAVTASYESEDRAEAAQWADGWEAFGFQARKAERWESGATDDE